jgi:hypothetical protein
VPNFGFGPARSLLLDQSFFVFASPMPFTWVGSGISCICIYVEGTGKKAQEGKASVMERILMLGALGKDVNGLPRDRSPTLSTPSSCAARVFSVGRLARDNGTPPPT